MSLQLKKQLSEGENVVRRLSKIALAARPSAEAEPKPDGRHDIAGQGGGRGGTGVFRAQKD